MCSSEPPLDPPVISDGSSYAVWMIWFAIAYALIALTIQNIIEMYGKHSIQICCFFLMSTKTVLPNTAFRSC